MRHNKGSMAKTTRIVTRLRRNIRERRFRLIGMHKVISRRKMKLRFAMKSLPYKKYTYGQTNIYRRLP